MNSFWSKLSLSNDSCDSGEILTNGYDPSETLSKVLSNQFKTKHKLSKDQIGLLGKISPEEVNLTPKSNRILEKSLPSQSAIESDFETNDSSDKVIRFQSESRTISNIINVVGIFEFDSTVHAL